MTRTQERPRVKGPMTNYLLTVNPINGIEVTGTCLEPKCKKTVYLKVPAKDVSSFQGCNRARCPICYPPLGDNKEIPQTYWYLEPGKPSISTGLVEVYTEREAAR